VTNSAGWTGNGNRPTRCRARPGSGGKKPGKTPTDRGENGTRKSLLVEGEGGPLGLAITGADVVEPKMLKETIEAIVVERPEPDEVERDLNLDQGYDHPRSREAAAEAGDVPHIRRIGEEKKSCDRSKGHKPRRWVVERTFAWLSKCRGLLVRYEKKDDDYLGLIPMARGLLWYRRPHRMGRSDATQNTT
jgi:putative transposase